MITLRDVKDARFIGRFFSDESLTKKASLNAVAAYLDYAARLAVGFLITPILVGRLGNYLYGTWQILNRSVDYFSPVSGRPLQALKFTLATKQASNDHDQKRRDVGSAVVVWALFLPAIFVFGALLVWRLPHWLRTPPEYIWHVRWATAFLVANLAGGNLSDLPVSVLQGENLGYKRMGLSTLLVFVGGGLTCAAIYLGTSIQGVAAAALIATLLTGFIFYRITSKYAPWFKVVIPPFRATIKFLSLSSWFMVWNLVVKLISASDVIVLGILNSVESVAGYSLTKYAPETLITMIAMIVSGIIPGMGGIIGSGKMQKALRVRAELMSLSWLIMTFLGATILLWNRAFIKIWVGSSHYVGTAADFLIVVVVAQYVLIRNDAAIIDLSLDMRRKVLLGALSAGVSIALAILFVGHLRMGIIGLSLGLMIGRLLLTITYPLLVGRLLGSPLLGQIRAVWRPGSVTLLFFGTAALFNFVPVQYVRRGIAGWASFFVSAGMTCCVTMLLAFFSGLNKDQRLNILRRVRAMSSARPE